MLNRRLFQDTKESSWGVAFRDLITATLGVLLIIVVILKTDVGKKEEDLVTKAIPGSITVFIEWPKDKDVDIDLWVKNEKEISAIGFSNKSGLTLDLLRDDLGHTFDKSNFNMELLTSRGIIEGQWTVNVHYYSAKENRNGKLKIFNFTEKVPVIPVNVSIDIYTRNSGKYGNSKQIYSGTVLLTTLKEEITVLNFTINNKGKVEENSFNTIQKRIAYTRDQPG